jgi:hypothetical protein
MSVKRILASGLLATSLSITSAGSALAFDGSVQSRQPHPFVQEFQRHFLRHRFRTAGEVISVDTSNNVIVIEDKKGGQISLNYNDQTKFFKDDVVSELEIAVGDQVRVKGHVAKESQALIAQVIRIK